MPFPERIVLGRQVPDLPSAAGISGDATLGANPAIGTAAPSLDVDSGAAPAAPSGSGLPLASGHTPVVTLPASSISTSASTSHSPHSSTSSVAAASSAKPIPISTVVGSCIGAFIGAVLLIALAVWFYRRYQRSLKSSYVTRGRGPVSHRDFRQPQRSGSWGKLEDRNSEDKWEGRAKPHESVAPMEKLIMFTKPPSLRTAYTNSEEQSNNYVLPHPFAAPFPLHNTNPGLGVQVAPSNHDPNPVIHQNANAHVLSWDESANGPYVSLHDSRQLSGSMSPLPIPTPQATSSPLHHWESAEILSLDAQSAEIVNPFGDHSKPTSHTRRRSASNPFFGAHEHIPGLRSRSNSIASKTSKRRSASSESSRIPVPRLDKGKQKAIDPFHDDYSPNLAPLSFPAAITDSVQTVIAPSIPTVITSAPSPKSPLPPPRPSFTSHNPSMSASSVTSAEHALAQLLAALDGDATQADVQDRLRIASMQPSEYSTNSMYSETEDVTNEFPLPPATPTSGYFTTESKNS